MSVTRLAEDNIGYVEIDNPPVNAIGQSVRQGLLEAVRWAEKAMLTRVIVTGKGSVFAAGADAREFDKPSVEPHLPDVLNAIDESFVPWVAVINGVALGGGAEIAMACRMRIMTPDAKIGLPEVTLGLIPGAGGTQRLPRLVGLVKALDMITSGKPLDANAALGAGLVHEIEENAMEAAYLVNTEALGCVVPTWELPAPQHSADVFQKVREKTQQKMAGQAAPECAVDVIEHGLSVPFHDALTKERSAFLELRGSEQAKALRHVFFAERAAKPPKTLSANPIDLNHIAVVGGGTMGAGIAYALLNANYSVTVLETDDEAVERAANNVESTISTSLETRMINADRAEDHRRRLQVTTDYSSVSNAGLAIEAVFEDLSTKKEIFKKLQDVLSPAAVLATNTSYLDINDIASVVNEPSRVVGLHFFAPAHIMKLLEIIKTDTTSDVAIATGFALAKPLRKIPVLAKVCDGFIGNRILARYREAADTVFMDGSSPWEVDEAMVEFGYAMGPYEAQDLSGLDIAHANRRRQDATRDPNRRYIPIADRMIELGKLGKKTGAGWYRYPGGGGKVDDPIVADLGLEEAHFAGITRCDYSMTDIQERLTLAMINEAADILDEGIAQSASDIDLVTVLGYGFPRWRGGLMHYADTVGAQAIVNRLQAFEKEDPIAWNVSPLLMRCANDAHAIADAKPSGLLG